MYHFYSGILKLIRFQSLLKLSKNKKEYNLGFAEIVPPDSDNFIRLDDDDDIK